MLPAIIGAVGWIGGGLSSLVSAIIGSTIGQLAIAFAAGWLMSGAVSDRKHDLYIKQQMAEYARESASQEAAAREIAEAATRRVEDDDIRIAGLNEQIAALEKEERQADDQAQLQPIIVGKRAERPKCSLAVVRPCVIDNAFAQRVRWFDASSAYRKAKPASGSIRFQR